MKAWAEATVSLLIILAVVAGLVGVTVLFGWLSSIIGWIAWGILGLIFCAGIWLVLYWTAR